MRRIKYIGEIFVSRCTVNRTYKRGIIDLSMKRKRSLLIACERNNDKFPCS